MLRIGIVASVLLVLFATACSTIDDQGTDVAAVPEPVRDGAPLWPISADEVQDAVPRADPILAAGNRSPYTVNGVTYEVMDSHIGYRERGIASWYGAKFDGRLTSNGEVYDLYAPTAAHKTLPIPCYARVTNLDNGRSVIVRVNDRGPFHSDRLIDLSYAAAVKLGYMEQGTARVDVEVVQLAGADDRREAVSGHYRYLQLGAFSSRDSAERLVRQLTDAVAVPVEIEPVETAGERLYRVRVGPMGDNGSLLAMQERLQALGFGPGQLLP